MTGAAVTELLQEHVVASVLKQMRLKATLGESFPWHVDHDAGTLHTGHLSCPADVVGTESAATDTFLWGWADPGAPSAAASERVRRLGVERGIDELTSDGAHPLETMDAGLASLIATGVAELEGYFIAMIDDGSISFALRSEELRGRPISLFRLPSSFFEVAAMLPFSHRRAFAHYLARPLPEVPAAIDDGRAVLRGAEGTAAVSFDREGRVAEIRVEESPRG